MIAFIRIIPSSRNRKYLKTNWRYWNRNSGNSQKLPWKKITRVVKFFCLINCWSPYFCTTHYRSAFNEDDGMVNSSKRNDFTEIGIQFREGNLPKNKTYITKLEFLAHRSNATFYNPAPPMKSIQVSPYVFVSFSFTNTSS